MTEINIGPNCATCEAAASGGCPAFNLISSIDELGGDFYDGLTASDSAQINQINDEVRKCTGPADVNKFMLTLGQSAGSVAVSIVCIDRKVSMKNRNNPENVAQPLDPHKLEIARNNFIGFYPYPDRLASISQYTARKVLLEHGIL